MYTANAYAVHFRDCIPPRPRVRISLSLSDPGITRRADRHEFFAYSVAGVARSVASGGTIPARGLASGAERWQARLVVGDLVDSE